MSKTERKRFVKFNNGNFDVDNTPRSESPEFEEEHLKALIKEDTKRV